MNDPCDSCPMPLDSLACHDCKYNEENYPIFTIDDPDPPQYLYDADDYLW